MTDPILVAFDLARVLHQERRRSLRHLPDNPPSASPPTVPPPVVVPAPPIAGPERPLTGSRCEGPDMTSDAAATPAMDAA